MDWCQAFTYDAYGNRAAVSQNQGVSSLAQVSISGFNGHNQNGTSNWSYDAAGNVLADPGPSTYAYDAENHQIFYCFNTTAACTSSNATANYSYDGNGKRIQMRNSSGTTTYVYDANGELIADYGPPETSPCAETCYVTVDSLGSTRMLTDQGGAPVQCFDYLPFGQTINRNSLACYDLLTPPPRPLFTSKERDSESGLDYFGARYFSSAQGRFTSPDQPFADQHPNNPQSWNLYTYALNNPLRYVDDNGFKVNEAAVARAQEQIKATVAAGGSTMTFVFLGINSGESKYQSTFTYQHVADFSGMFGLGDLDTSPSGNTAVLPNENFIINAALGRNAVDQLDTANAIAPLARDAGLNLDMITHSNGVNSGGMFAAQNQLGTSAVIAPNTGSTATMNNIVNASRQTTIISSPRDSALAWAPLAGKSPSIWQKIFGTNPNVTVVQTNQKGHGAQCYGAEVQGQDSTKVAGCK